MGRVVPKPLGTRESGEVRQEAKRAEYRARGFAQNYSDATTVALNGTRPMQPGAQLTLGTTAPTDPAHASPKVWVEAKAAERISRSGDAMNAPLSGPAPTAPSHYGRKQDIDDAEVRGKTYADAAAAARISRNGDFANAPIGGPAPTAPSHYSRQADTDAAEARAKSYTDGLIPTRLALTGGTMTGLLNAQQGLATKVIGGAVTDASFLAVPPNGTIGVDVTNSRLYVRLGAGIWKSAALV